MKWIANAWDWLLLTPEPEPVPIHPRQLRLDELAALYNRMLAETGKIPTPAEIWEEDASRY